MMCHVLRVGRSGYYHWLHALPSSRALENKKIATVIKAVFIENRGIIDKSVRVFELT